MKTHVKSPKFRLNAMYSAASVALLLFVTGVSAQETDSVKALFKPDVRVSEQWVPEVKINSIQGDIGTLVGIYGGALINRTVLVGISGGVNLGHPRVNYGYFGGILQYIHHPANLAHWSGQVVAAYGSTKDYEHPKEGLLDNFWNISGASFFLLEPGLNVEVNLGKRVTLITGISYRFVSGLDERNENIQVTHVTNRELSGLNFSMGLKFMKMPKK